MENRKNTGQEMKIGRHGEDLVRRFLIEEGHTVLDRNWRYGHLELDLVTMDANGIHFVEVKSRRTPMQAEPEESVNATKRRRMVRAAEGYLRVKGLEDMECSFDVASVTFDGQRTEIRYLPEAFIPIR